MDAEPRATAAVKSFTTRRQKATSSGSGANRRLAGTCEGWMQILPWKPSLRAMAQSSSKPRASRTDRYGPSIGRGRPAARASTTRRVRAWNSSAPSADHRIDGSSRSRVKSPLPKASVRTRGLAAAISPPRTTPRAVSTSGRMRTWPAGRPPRASASSRSAARAMTCSALSVFGRTTQSRPAATTSATSPAVSPV